MPKKFHHEKMAEGVDLYLGDCTEVLPSLKPLHLIVTSPPYDKLRTYGGHTVDTFKVIKQCADLLKPGGVLMWNVRDQTIKGSQTGTSFRQALHAMDCGLFLHDTMIYIRSGVTFPDTNRYLPAFEYMFVLSNGPPKHFNGIKDRANKIVGHRAPGAYRQTDGTLKHKIKVDAEVFGLRYNYWNMYNLGNKEFGDHPATMPPEMAKDHIETWTDEGETVLDPFMGSGTTGVAAIEMGRKFVGIEINPEYYDVSCKRLYKALRSPSIHVAKPEPLKQKDFNETWLKPK
jgi:site-specific DNA-methyltransferase (adenine-specific)